MEHDLTHWYGTTSEKILSWRELRRQTSNMALDVAIKKITDWWTYAPWVKKTIDPYRPETWPTPWDMISKGHFCRNALALGQAYTIWILFHDVECELWLINNKSEQDIHLVVVVNKNIVLNYNMGHVESLDDIDYELLSVVNKDDLSHIKL